MEGKLEVWDSPGDNDDFKFYDAASIAFFQSMDRVFIAYPDSLKSCNELVRVMYAVKPNDTYLVRTKCDQEKPSDIRTVEEEVEIDKKLLKKWNINIPILATSSRRNFIYRDNEKFRQLLISK